MTQTDVQTCENCNDTRTVTVLDLRLGAWVRQPCEVCSWEEPNGRGQDVRMVRYVGPQQDEQAAAA